MTSSNLFRVLLSAFYVASFAFAGFQMACPPEKPHHFELSILHLNDHHSRLDEETQVLTHVPTADGVSETVVTVRGGAERISRAMSELGARNQNVLKIHAGDALTGDLYFSQTKGQSDAVFLNHICFDAFALGNHEFDNGDADLNSFLALFKANSHSCQTHLLSINIHPGAALKTEFERTVVATRGGDRIGLIGLTPGSKIKNSSRPDPDTQFDGDEKLVQSAIDDLRARGINKIILVTHQGFTEDRQFAQKLSGVDAIIGGDSHTLLGHPALERFGVGKPEASYPLEALDRDGKKVCIGHAWQYNAAIGEMHMSFDEVGDVVDCSGRAHVIVGTEMRARRGADSGIVEVPLTAFETAHANAALAKAGIRATAKDEGLVRLLKPFRSAKAEFSNAVIGQAKTDFCFSRAPVSSRYDKANVKPPSCQGDMRVARHGGDVQQLVAQAFLAQARRFGGADIVIQNGGGVRDALLTGAVTMNSAFALLPFKNVLVRVVMSGVEVKNVIEDGVDAFLAGNSGSYPYAAAMRWDIIASASHGNRVKNIEFKNAAGKWVPFEERSEYKVVTNEYLSIGKDGFTAFGLIHRDRIENTYLEYAQAFRDYVKSEAVQGRLLERMPENEYSTKSFKE